MKEMKITPPDGYEVDKENSTFESIKFKPIKKELPKSWDELGEIQGYFVSTDSDVIPFDMNLTCDSERNVFPSKEEAEASIALAQLCQLRDRYNDGWNPDWTDYSSTKYDIYFFDNDIAYTTSTRSHRVLTFRTEELRDEFIENHRDLIEKAKPLL